MRATKARKVQSERVRRKYGGESAILDWGTRESAKDEVTFEQGLKVVREQEGTGLGKAIQKMQRQQQVWPVKGIRTLE